MYYYGREEQDKATQRIIREHRQAAAAFPRLKKVVTAFDGKAFNCRLEKALNEDPDQERIYVSKRYKWLEFHTYHNGTQYTIAAIKLEDMPEGKRIPAELIIKSAEEKRIELLRKAAEIEKASEQIDTIKAQVEQLGKILSGIMAAVPYEVKDIYRVGYKITV
jgi:uncharacterized protein YqfA (UPF0365 family)